MGCHAGKSTKQHDDLMATTHWTWKHVDAASGQQLGKRYVINNFCIATASNEPRCTSCHVGIGWRDNTFDFTDRSKVDCLVCHDTTGTYKKTPTNAGVPDPSVDLVFVAQNAGLSSRATCGTCHFFGGGGDAVKHGDLDSTMANPTRAVDVHMGTDGGNFTCAECHSKNTAEGSNRHDFHGTNYPATSADHELCQKCHTATPHTSSRLNSHAARVSCQACHIPAFARGGKFTKQTWDWSTAGDRNPDNSQKVVKDADGNPTYDSMKGTFSWKDKVVPEYRWFNGNVTYATLDTPVAPGQRLTINQMHGDVNDADARLFPVKRFTGSQPYDAGTGKLAIPHLFPSNAADTAAYWKGYSWDNALAAGQAAVGRTYSGTMGVVDTEMFWVQNHMVAPKENALGCADCHSPGGRIDFANLGYTPERAAALQSFYPIEVIAFEMAAPGAGISLSWTTNVNYFRYQVQSSMDLATWDNEPDGKFTGGGTPQEFVFTDAAPAGSPAKKFYRVVRSTQ
jgi:octaheme c-type cytochrome (tetrathionate reductase family)